VPGGGLYFFLPPLSRHSGTTLPVSRQNGRGHQLRPAMSLPQEDQFKHLFGRSSGRCQGSRRRYLARQLHALRPRLYRSGGKNSAAPRALGGRGWCRIASSTIRNPEADSSPTFTTRRRKRPGSAPTSKKTTLTGSMHWIVRVADCLRQRATSARSRPSSCTSAWPR
jgi:hypothetical protein